MVRRAPTGQLMTDDGQPLTADPTAQPLGERPGVTFRTKEAPMAKAEQDGVYRMGRTHVKVRKGQVIPAGAEPVEDTTQERKKGPAPENRAEGAAPESRKRTSKKADE